MTDADLELIRRIVAEQLRAVHRPDQDQMLTTAEAAQLLSVSAGTIRNWAKAGRLTAHGSGALTRFRRADVLVALDGPADDVDARADAILRRVS